MDHPEVKESEATVSIGGSDAPVPATSAGSSVRPLAPQACPTCGTVQGANGADVAAPHYVYALGRIAPRFPRISTEKEFAQATGRTDTGGLTDRQALHAVLSRAENRYLVRQLCWVMTIEGLDTYIVVPRELADYGLLVEALRPTPSPMDLDCLIGVRGPMAGPEVCNGLMVPIVAFDQLYSFDRDVLMKAIPRREKTSAKAFAPAAEELFDRLMLMADNAGATDEHRALNYLAVRYPAIYANAAEAFERNASLIGVDVVPSPLSGTRNVVDVVFSYRNRSTDVVEKFFCRVDVTEEFPFLVTKLSPYIDR